MAVLLGLALSKLVLYVVAAGRYGIFRDELYYIACGRHLAFGYVDHPPFVALIANLTDRLLGDSLYALRLLPALTGVLTVLLAGLIARELGGGRFAQALAAIAVIISPAYLFLNNYLSMNCFDALFWVLGAYVLVLLLKRGNRQLWLLFGVIAGVGLQNKHSMLFFGFGVFVALLLTPARQDFRSKWLWLGALIAIVIFLPNVIWEIRYGWPTLEFMRRAEVFKNVRQSPLGFLAEQIAEQIMEIHPLAFLILLAGLGYFFLSRHGQPYRLFGWIYLAILALFLVERAKAYYLAPVYPIMLAAGAVWIETAIRRRRWNWLRPVIISLLVVGGTVTAPFTLPILPVETFIRYERGLGLQPLQVERHALGPLPQLYADMFVWENMAASVARVYKNLPASERARCAIYGQNYGEAGAMDFFRPRYGLPRAVSGHNNYWLWGLGSDPVDVLIIIGGRRSDHQKVFEHVEQAALIKCDYAMPYETNLPVFICRTPKVSLRDAWATTKHYE